MAWVGTIRRESTKEETAESVVAVKTQGAHVYCCSGKGRDKSLLRMYVCHPGYELRLGGSRTRRIIIG